MTGLMLRGGTFPRSRNAVNSLRATEESDVHSIRISREQWPIVIVGLRGAFTDLVDDAELTEAIVRDVESIRGRGEPYVVLLDALHLRWKPDDSRVKPEPVREADDSQVPEVDGDRGQGPHPLQDLVADSLGVVLVTPTPWLRTLIRLAAMLSRLTSRGPQFRFTAVETLQEGRNWAGELLDGEGTSGGIGAAPIVPR